jgi:hypothetical protein
MARRRKPWVAITLSVAAVTVVVGAGAVTVRAPDHGEADSSGTAAVMR